MRLRSYGDHCHLRLPYFAVSSVNVSTIGVFSNFHQQSANHLRVVRRELILRLEPVGSIGSCSVNDILSPGIGP